MTLRLFLGGLVPRLAVAALGLVALGASLRPAPARACGGFFCSAAQPVNQQAERIVFATNDDGTVTAIIEIQYSGPSERFAWVLPVEGTPEIGVSSNIVFQRLQQQTNPQYTIRRQVEGTCRQDSFMAVDAASFGGADSGSAVFDAGTAAEDASAPVSVVDSGSVGPYDWVAIMVDPEAASVGDVAVDWLQDNGYDVDDSGRRTLTPYLQSGMNLVAFRLTKSGNAGTIRPITVTFRTERPGIPILPTAVAAEPDMGVLVWVLSENRAIPQNYLHIELNDALINWFNPGSNYGVLVSDAADEAGGQGFVTELAGLSSSLQPIINEWELLPNTTGGLSGPDDYAYLNAVVASYSGWDGVREALATVPFPDDLTVEQFLNGQWFGREDRTIEGFDREAFLEAFHAEVVAPVEDAQQLIDDHRYVTRLYTTMSPAEMTLDPIFDFNPDLAEVSNVHTATRIIECNESVYEWEAAWRVELPSGAVVRGSGAFNSWPFTSSSSSDMPATRRVERLETSGAPVVLENNEDAIGQRIDQYNAEVPAPVSSAGGPGRAPGSGSIDPGATSGDGGCQASSHRSSGASLALLVGLVLVSRSRSARSRRRRRRAAR